MHNIIGICFRLSILSTTGVFVWVCTNIPSSMPNVRMSGSQFEGEPFDIQRSKDPMQYSSWSFLTLDFCFMVLDKNLLISNCVHVGVRTSHSSWIVQLLSRWQLVELGEPDLARVATAYHVAGQFWQQHVLYSLRPICEHMLQKLRAGPIKADQLIDSPRSLSGTTCVAKGAQWQYISREGLTDQNMDQPSHMVSREGRTTDNA